MGVSEHVHFRALAFGHGQGNRCVFAIIGAIQVDRDWADIFRLWRRFSPFTGLSNNVANDVAVNIC